jgi:hypothetical protein
VSDNRFRGLTLHQPWASLMAWGYKTIETRPWQINYRGPMVIHAAKAFQPYAVENCMANIAIRRIIVQKMQEAGVARDTRLTRSRLEELLPLGMIVARCDLVDIVRTEVIVADMQRRVYSATEREFGNYSPHRYGWITRNLVALPRPIAYTGMQGLWYLDPAFDELIA